MTLVGTREDSTHPQVIDDGIVTSELVDTNQHGPSEPTEVISRNTFYELPLNLWQLILALYRISILYCTPFPSHARYKLFQNCPEMYFNEFLPFLGQKLGGHTSRGPKS